MGVQPSGGRIVLFSPVRQSPSLLEPFLRHLEELSTDSLDVRFWFHDDNDLAPSTRLLEDFCASAPARRRILRSLSLEPAPYERGEYTHVWTTELIERITAIKNRALEEFLETRFDAMFLVDSDLALHPNTLEHLAGLGLPIVAEVFWTQWKPGLPLLPNVWKTHAADIPDVDFVLQLARPGQFPVGGLGACTLVRREPLKAGVSFRAVPGLNLVGEDRPFCVRAACLGFELVADTLYPPYHLYRPSMVPRLGDWCRLGHARSYFEAQLGEAWKDALRRFYGVPSSESWLDAQARLLKKANRVMT